MKNKLAGQITLETAIVMPIVMIIVAALMCISLYIHDVIAIKSYGYSFAIEYRDGDLDSFTKNISKEIKKIPLFVMKINAECSKENGAYKVVIHSKSSNKTGLLSIFFDNRKPVTVEVEKKINTEIMYASRAVFDKLD